ncbi:MAG: hypothetical protein QGG42_02030 [Phycisphaerae bacterium]|nr:hypothetical protein [Phycisphaerae bacterium]
MGATCVVVLPLLFAVVMALRVTGGGASAWKWLPKALASGGFVKYALITMVLGAALLLVCVMLWRIGARARRRCRSEEGGAIVEFALVLPLATALVLLLAQSSFLMVGHLCVQYSAYCAARAAIVVIPDDLAQYGGEAQNYVDPNPDNSLKQGRILRAAAWAVMPISCSIRAQEEASEPELVEGLEEFFTAYGKPTPGWVRANLQRKWKYAIDHTFVELSPPISGDLYGEDEDVLVRVEHTFYLSVPIARTIFKALSGDDGVELDIGIGEYGMVMRATCSLTNEGVQDYVDEETFPKDR